jgi:hypothetical protein
MTEPWLSRIESTSRELLTQLTLVIRRAPIPRVSTNSGLLVGICLQILVLGLICIDQSYILLFKTFLKVFGR